MNDTTPPQDRHESSRAAFEAGCTRSFDTEDLRDEAGDYFSPLRHVMWGAWCRALDWQAEQQAELKCVWVPCDDVINVLYGTSCLIGEMGYEEEPNFDKLPFCPGCGRRVEVKEMPQQPQPEWRPLEPGEIIQEGDEWRTPRDVWRPSQCIGDGVDIGEVDYYRTRRPLPTPTPATPTPCPVCEQMGGQCLGHGLLEYGTPACIDCGMCHDGPCEPATPTPALTLDVLKEMTGCALEHIAAATPTPDKQTAQELADRCDKAERAVEWAEQQCAFYKAKYKQDNQDAVEWLKQYFVVQGKEGLTWLDMDSSFMLAYRCKNAEAELAKARERLIAPDSDSPVAACNCLIKTPDPQFHRAGCRYRLITERDEARERIAELEGLADALAWLEDEVPNITHDAWTCSVDMSGNRWTLSFRNDGKRERIRGRTLIDTINTARKALTPTDQ